jgi:hypothetical protein
VKEGFRAFGCSSLAPSFRFRKGNNRRGLALCGRCLSSSLKRPQRKPLGPQLGSFLCAVIWNSSAGLPLSAVQEADMARWRKRNPTAARFNAQLTGWALAFSALAGILLALSIHGGA